MTIPRIADSLSFFRSGGDGDGRGGSGIGVDGARLFPENEEFGKRRRDLGITPVR